MEDGRKQNVYIILKKREQIDGYVSAVHPTPKIFPLFSLFLKRMCECFDEGDGRKQKIYTYN